MDSTEATDGAMAPIIAYLAECGIKRDTNPLVVEAYCSECRSFACIDGVVPPHDCPFEDAKDV